MGIARRESKSLNERLARFDGKSKDEVALSSTYLIFPSKKAAESRVTEQADMGNEPQIRDVDT